MSLDRLASRLRELFRRGALDRELTEELQTHHALLAEEYERQGVAPPEARRRAAAQLGSLDAGREAVYAVRGLAPLEHLGRDVVHAVRVLRKAPGFTAATLATLALGIAVNVAIFSIVDAVVLRPLPYAAPERLMSIWEVSEGGRLTVAPGNLADYRQARSLSAIAGFAAVTRNVTASEPAETLLGEEVTANYFSVLGIGPALGRDFTPADERPQASRVVILSDGFWRRRFAAEPGVLGGVVELDGDRYQIVGVMPPAFRGVTDTLTPDRRSFWTPARYPADLLANRGDHEIRLVARLAPDASIDAARAELLAISGALAQAYPATNRTIQARLDSLLDDIVGGVRTSLVVLLLTVGVILTIACVNVANLCLARGVARRREIAVRVALGASRARVVTALVAENLVIALVAGIAGGILAGWIQTLLVAAAPPGLPRLDEVAMDLRVVGYTALVALVTGTMFGLIPAWQAGSGRATDMLAGAGRVVAGAAVMRWRNLLMLTQVALSAILLVGAGLMVKSLVRLNSVPLGFETANVIAARAVLPERRYRTALDRLRFFEEVERRAAQLPGVEAVGFANALPLRGGWSGGFVIEGITPPPGEGFEADLQAVSPGYFRALGVTLAAGRLTTPGDTLQAAPVAIVSRMFERQFLGGGSAIGRRIRRHPTAPALTVVGVVDDVRRDGRTSALAPQVYLPAAQTASYPVRLADLAVRTSGNPREVAPALRSIVSSIDPEQPLTNIRTLDDLLAVRSADRRFQAVLFSLFAALALVLASVGTYGVVAYVVTQRTPEIGVRLALGATPASLYRWLLARTLAVVATGAVLGLVLARWLAEFVTTMLFEVTAGDAGSYVAAGLGLTLAAVAASLLAGRRATAIDPTQALRFE